MTTAGSAGRLSLSDDGTLVNFAGFEDNNSVTPDETFGPQPRNRHAQLYQQFNLPLSYTSVSFGGSQARSATTLDDTNYVVMTKAACYIGGPNVENSPFAFNTPE